MEKKTYNILWIDDNIDAIRPFIQMVEKTGKIKFEKANNISLGMKKMFEKYSRSESGESPLFDAIFIDIFLDTFGRRDDIPFFAKEILNKHENYNPKYGIVFLEFIRESDDICPWLHGYFKHKIPIVLCSRAAVKFSASEILESLNVICVSKSEILQESFVLDWFTDFEAGFLHNRPVEIRRQSDKEYQNQNFPKLYQTILHQQQVLLDNFEATIEETLSLINYSVDRSRKSGNDPKPDNIYGFGLEKTLEAYRAIPRSTKINKLGKLESWRIIENEFENIIDISPSNAALEADCMDSIQIIANQILHLSRQTHGDSELHAEIQALYRCCIDFLQLKLKEDLLDTRVKLFDFKTQVATFLGYVNGYEDTNQKMNKFDVEHLCRNLINENGKYAEVQGVELDLYVARSPHDFHITGYKEEIKRALNNLMVNGIKYSHPNLKGKPWVKIKISSDDLIVIVEVESWGPQIHKNEIEEGLIFQEGYRGKEVINMSKTGSGLGLADTKFIVEDLHRGKIKAESNYESATRNQKNYINLFTIELPKISGL